MEDVLARLAAQTPTTSVLLVPATLRYLRNSRRIGSFAMALATLLSITPVIACEPDRMAMLARTGSWDEALDRMIAELELRYADGPPDEIAVNHAQSPQAATILERVQQSFPGVPTHLSDMGPVIAVNTGPGAIGIASYRL